VPQLCLLLYRSSFQGGDELDNTIAWMKAHHAVSPLVIPALLCSVCHCLYVSVDITESLCDV
jgi:hypothetical protein